MTSRKIDRELLSSADLYSFGAIERLLWVGLVLLADDDGLVRADPRWLRNRVLFGLRASTSRIERALEAFALREMVGLERINGRPYLRLLNFEAYQSGLSPRYRDRDRERGEVASVLRRQWGFSRRRAAALARERTLADLDSWLDWQADKGLGKPLLCHLIQHYKTPEEMARLDGEPFDAADVLKRRRDVFEG